MTSRFRSLRSQAGFTLFEALISLAILSLVLTIVVSSARGPSPALRAQSQVAQLIRDAESVRLNAIQNGVATEWEPEVTVCDPENDPKFIFFADGTARGPEICLPTLRLRIHPLTGLMIEVSS